MTAEKTTVRPAVATVLAVASTKISQGRSWAGALGQMAHLLAEPADHEQAVVDAQTEAEDRHDVDDGGLGSMRCEKASSDASPPPIEASARRWASRRR